MSDFEAMWSDLAPLGRAATSGGYRRSPFLAAERECVAWFRAEASSRGMRLEEDGFGNVAAWWGSGTPAVLTGSHLDSVLDGGAFDGPLGIVSAFAAVDLLRSRGFEPRGRLGVVAFAEEEGSRFGRACLGSGLAVGAVAPDAAEELTDRTGVRLGDAWADAGLDPTRGSSLLDDVACFVELHVEQGRRLVDLDAAVGLASGIWPHGRYRFEFAGEANHAGSTRMEDRRDPMLTYAVTALAANKHARLGGGRATFGRLSVEPNGTNAVPSLVTAWLDARAATDHDLRGLVDDVMASAAQRAERDGTDVAVTVESISKAIAFTPGLLGERGWPVLPSQAGHDAGVLAAVGIPAAMVFVRNPTGVSHSPAEHAETADCLAGVEALAAVLADLAS